MRDIDTSLSTATTAKLLARAELQEEEIEKLRLDSARQAARIQRQNDEIRMLRHQLQEVLLRESSTKQECEMLLAGRKTMNPRRVCCDHSLNAA